MDMGKHSDTSNNGSVSSNDNDKSGELKVLLMALVVFGVVFGGYGLVKVINHYGYTAVDKCNSTAGYEWSNYVLENKNNPATYKFETCINKSTQKIEFSEDYHWKKLDKNDDFSNKCRDDNGQVYTNVFDKEAGVKRNGKNNVKLYLYDHLYGCVVDDMIKNYYVNTTPDKNDDA